MSRQLYFRPNSPISVASTPQLQIFGIPKKNWSTEYALKIDLLTEPCVRVKSRRKAGGLGEKGSWRNRCLLAPSSLLSFSPLAPPITILISVHVLLQWRMLALSRWHNVLVFINIEGREREREREEKGPAVNELEYPTGVPRESGFVAKLMNEYRTLQASIIPNSKLQRWNLNVLFHYKQLECYSSSL